LDFVSYTLDISRRWQQDCGLEFDFFAQMHVSLIDAIACIIQYLSLIAPGLLLGCLGLYFALVSKNHPWCSYAVLVSFIQSSYALLRPDRSLALHQKSILIVPS
jgi:hypothetical protein